MTASTAANKTAARKPRTNRTTDTETTETETVEQTPSEQVDALMAAEDVRAELLSDLPPLRPARRFRLGHRNRFHDLLLEAAKSGAFDRDDMEYDLSDPKDIEDFQKLQKFVESIDDWAESIAEDAEAYALWSEGKTEEHFMALFAQYKADLGESSGSEN